jgi:hypothetical protein
MLAALLGAVRADLDRQVAWAREEARRQARYAAVIGAITVMAALAGLGALIVGLIALHSWLTPQVGALASLDMIGAGLLSLMLVLLLVAFLLRRPGLKARPALLVGQPAALFRSNLESNQAIAGGEDSLLLTTGTSRESTRSQLLVTLALIVVAGMIAGRKFRAGPPKK